MFLRKTGFIFLLISTQLLLVFLCNAETEVKREPSIQKLYDDFLSFFQEQDPLRASTKGYRNTDALLPNMSLPAILAVEQKCRQFVSRSQTLQQELEGQLKANDVHYLKRLEHQAQSCVDSFKFKGFLLAPVDLLQGVQKKLPQVFSQAQYFKELRTKADYELVLTRMEQIPTYLSQLESLLKLGVKENVTFAKESLIKTKSQFDKLQVSPVDSDFFTFFKDIKSLGKDDVWELQSKALDLIAESVLPAFEKLGRYVHEEYFYSVRESTGLVGTAGGHAHYEACVKNHASIRDTDPESVHQRGLDEVERLTKLVLAKGAELDFPAELKTVKEVFDHASKQPGQKFNTSQEIEDMIGDFFQNRVNPALKDFFEERLLNETLLDMEIRTIPNGGGSIFAYYKDPTRVTKGIYYQNTNVKNINRFELPAVALHEGIPGHHLHIGVFNAISGLPDFATFGPIAYSFGTCPSILPRFNGFSEGWALYAESLGIEMGIYEEDPLSIFGYYSFNLLRAARLVVDSGIHYYGWSRQEVADYLFTNTAFTEESSKNEADRYITWPGQALSYKLGAWAIEDARKLEEEKLGDKFDIKRFHSDLFSCYGALETLEDCLARKKEGDSA